MNPLLTIQLDIMGGWRLSLFLMAFSVFCVLLRLARGHIETTAVAAFGWAVLRGIFILEYPTMQYGDANFAFMSSAGQATVELLILGCFACFASAKVRKLIPFFIGVEMAMVWVFGCGFMMQTSFDTATIALCIPYLNWWMTMLAILTILCHHGTTALLILGAILFALLLRHKRDQFMHSLMACFALVGGCAAIYHNHDMLLNGGERLAVWHRYMAWWWDQGWPVILFGTGLGSFTWLNLVIDKFKEPHFIQMHNDWLQITFELGLVGVGLVVAAFVTAIRRAWREFPLAVPATFGLAAFMLTYHPLRFAPTMVITVFIAFDILKTRKAQSLD